MRIPLSILGRPAGIFQSDVPAWAPTAGQIKQISHPSGYFGVNGGATLAEISPQYQDWNPIKPDISIYGNGYSFGSWYGYCGAAFNADTRQIVHYGTGHVSINVCAPLCFDLNDLRWKWLDTPLPFDSLGKLKKAGIAYPTRAQVETYYPPEQYNFEWGEVNGDWPGWPAGYGRPGKIQPLPTHSYGTQVCIPAKAMGNKSGGYLMFGSYEGVINVSGASGSHVFDFDTKTWSRGGNHWFGGAQYARGARADPVTGKVIVFGASGPTLSFYVFDPATRLWSARTASGNGATTNTDHPGNVIHEAARLYIIPGQIQANGQPATWQYPGVKYKFQAASIDAILGVGSFSITALSVNEQSAWPLTSLGVNTYLGWGYCPIDRCLYIINGENNSNKYWRLTPPVNATTQAEYLSGTWTLTEHVFTSGVVQSPGTTPRSMMFNRINWDGVSRSFVFWPDSVNGPVQAFRPAGIS